MVRAVVVADQALLEPTFFLRKTLHDYFQCHITFVPSFSSFELAGDLSFTDPAHAFLCEITQLVFHKTYGLKMTCGRGYLYFGHDV